MPNQKPHVVAAVKSHLAARGAMKMAIMNAGAAGQIARDNYEREKEARREAIRKAKENELLRREEARREYAAKQRRIAEHSNPDRIKAASKEQWFALFAQDGDDVIYNAISLGQTVPAYGVERGFPPFYFMEWCEQQLDRKKVILARRTAAALAAYQSVTAFDDPDTKSSMQAVHHVRAKAQHKTWMAERQDAEAWGPPKSVAPQQPPVALVVSIDGLSVPQDHLDKLAEKRADKLRIAAPVFDPQGERSVVDVEAIDG